MIVYHGTSIENLKSILQFGFIPDKSNWTASEDDKTYFWSPKHIAKRDDEDFSEDVERWNDEAKRMAYDNATVAMLQFKSSQCVVFAVQVPDDSESVEPDTSCNNMEGAIAVAGHISPDSITQVWIGPDLSMIRGYYIALIMNNDLLAIEFTDFELKIAKLFANADIYPYDEEWNQLEQMDYAQLKEYGYMGAE